MEWYSLVFQPSTYLFPDPSTPEKPKSRCRACSRISFIINSSSWSVEGFDLLYRRRSKLWPCLWDSQIARTFIHWVQLRCHLPRSSYSFMVWSHNSIVRERSEQSRTKRSIVSSTTLGSAEAFDWSGTRILSEAENSRFDLSTKFVTHNGS